jgi:hypothetical protein
MGAVTYLWRIARDCPENLIVAGDKRSLDATAFRAARLIFDDKVPVFVYGGCRSELCVERYFPNSFGLPLISQDAMEALKRLDVCNVQFVPAVINCRDGNLDAFIVNPIDAILGVDWSGSHAVLIPGTDQVMKFNSLRLIPEVLQGKHIARLLEYKSFVLVSDQVRRCFEGSNLCEFTVPEEIKK